MGRPRSIAVIVNAVVAVALVTTLFTDDMTPRIVELDLGSLCTPVQCRVFAYGVLWSAMAFMHAIRHYVCCEPALYTPHVLSHTAMWAWAVVLAYQGAMRALLFGGKLKLGILIMYTLIMPIIWIVSIFIWERRRVVPSSGTGGEEGPLLLV